ncbi:hypothetical protein GSI_05603 [Ganoderma sinense ZZ0214-1]|uniref:Uncharacterized protein n=1 Tax=Ganoderma sinense ZZ0214-1 TaxID=1077348 RepID=A0A2G8SF81_9APHY|nr:hypothetical protein GSI_05603 [Ganoderma sinense ZZ0214-1]
MPFPNIYGQSSYYQHPGSIAPPLVPPPRPSSAEPTPSQPLHNLPDGPAAPPPPLIPFPPGGTNDGHREEGKGERASRISHHLRLSSRHRSASPPAHRYQRERERVNTIVGSATIAPFTATLVLADVGHGHGHGHAAIISPSSSPQLHTRTGLALSPLHTGGSVVSPRPMLSPKLSFSKDPLEQVSQVQALERIAASSGGAQAADGEDRDRDKTLPRPPVPSGKESAAPRTPRGRADMLFPPDLLLADAGFDETPPTPTLAAVASTSASVLKVPRQRGASGGAGVGRVEGSGLDALEARLLAEVGTRKPERARAPDVRSVLSMPIPLPEPIAIPRAQAQDVVEPPVDSAISSLTLGGLEIDVDEKTLRRGKFSRGGGSERGFDVEVELGAEAGDDANVPGRTRESTQTTRGRDSQQTEGAKKDRERERERERERTGGSAGAKKSKHGSKHTAGSDGANKTKDKELQKLRKAAQGRITAWLGGIDDDPEPPESQAPPPMASPSPRRGRSPGAVARDSGQSLGVSPRRSPAVSPAVSPMHSRDPSPARSARRLTEPSTSLPKRNSVEVLANVAPVAPEPEQQETQAAPNPRSSGFLPIGTVRAHPQVATVNAKAGKKGLLSDAFLLPKASPRLGVYPPHPLDPEVKYDIRSARGGKGGIVTSVAAIWASATQPVSKEAASKPPPVPVKPRVNATKLAEQWKATAEQSGPATPKGPPAMKPKPEGLRSPKLAFGEGLRSPASGAVTPTVANGRPKALQPLAKTGYSSPTVTSPAADPMITSVADLTARRAKMIKSTSVPAVVSSSTATPMLSSTASLARPSPARAERVKMNARLPPTIAEAEPMTTTPKAQITTKVTATAEAASPASPPAKTDYAFGQARLRELIKRYQGQVNS